MIRVEETGRKLAEAEVLSLERRIGCRLPESYRRFLLETNGGRPPRETDVIDIHHLPGGEADVMLFFGIDRSVDSSTIEWNLRALEGRISNKLLPIARDSFGNRFCLSIFGSDYGSVVYCDFGPGWGFHMSDSVVYYSVAPDFDNFLERIRSIEMN